MTLEEILDQYNKGNITAGETVAIIEREGLFAEAFVKVLMTLLPGD